MRALIVNERLMIQRCADARDDSYDSVGMTFHMRNFDEAKQRLAVQEVKLAQLLARLAKK